MQLSSFAICIATDLDHLVSSTSIAADDGSSSSTSICTSPQSQTDSLATSSSSSSTCTSNVSSNSTYQLSPVTISDIASTPSCSPSQPIGINFLPLPSLEKHGILIQTGTGNTHGWNTPLANMLLFVSHAECLLQLVFV
jgi:hypothetical protein